MMEDTKFDAWLSERFRELNTDEDVFVAYIKSIVEEDSTSEEKIDALDGILGELALENQSLSVEAFRTEILIKWKQQQEESEDKPVNECDASQLDLKMKRLMQLDDNPSLISSTCQGEDKGSKTSKAPPTQIPDSTLRAAILNQCIESSDQDSGDDGPTTASSRGGGPVKTPSLERNTNTERVQTELKDRREREKIESAKKREKDKEDRVKQKKQAQERKDKAKKKTAKVERKRM